MGVPEAVLSRLFLIAMGVAGIVLVVVFVIALCRLAGEDEGWANAKKVANSIRQGRAAYLDVDYDLAIACANNALREEAQSTDALYLRSKALLKLGDHRLALADCCEMIRAKPDESLFYQTRANVYEALEDFDRAVADYCDAIRLDPKNTVYREERKQAQEKRRQRPKAGVGEPILKAELVIAPHSSDKAQPSAASQRFATGQALPTSPADPSKPFNGMAAAGFALGLASIPFYFIGILPILGIVFSAIGLGTFKPERQKAKWMAVTGLILGIIYSILSVTERHAGRG
jgi:tetratricopeptide (TPR) repeat protein